MSPHRAIQRDAPVNMLHEGILTVCAAKRGLSNLPQVLSALARSEDLHFAALQPHQEHPWYAFLVQLAAIALNRADAKELPDSEPAWCELLTALTKTEVAWTLVVEDESKPAFMQAPLLEGRSELRKETRFPDEIDILVPAKNHDLKAERIGTPRLEHWVYALVSLQTSQGFLGAGNYGIARMNGGFGNRPCVAIRPQGGLGARFVRDVKLLLDGRNRVIESFGYRKNGLALLWLEPWDGKSSLDLRSLDPYFIEICRRVRLQANETDIAARYGGSRKSRIDDQDRNGDVGDPWTPVDVAQRKSLTVSSSGFGYRLTQSLLLSEQYAPGVAFERGGGEDEPVEFFAWALVRGQGKTEGLHQRVIEIPSAVRGLWASTPTDAREELAERSRTQVAEVDRFVGRVLKPALLTLIQVGPTKLDFRDPRAQRHLDDFDTEVDDRFFVHLWAHANEPDPAKATVAWQKFLEQAGWTVLQRAIDSVSLPSTRRYRAIASAESTFRGAWFNQYSEAATTSDLKKERS